MVLAQYLIRKFEKRGEERGIEVGKEIGEERERAAWQTWYRNMKDAEARGANPSTSRRLLKSDSYAEDSGRDNRFGLLTSLLSQVVVGLSAHPELGVAPAYAFQGKGHCGRDSALTVQQLR